MSVVNKILSRRTLFSESELKIADEIMGFPEKVVNITSQQLSEQATVSQSSVVKFTQKIGFKGYSEFKLALAEELARKQATKETPMHSSILFDDPLAVIAQKLVQEKTEAMFQTTNALSFKELNQVVHCLNTAQRVQIIGIAGSALIAKDLTFKLLKLGIMVLNEQDSHVQIATARTLSKEDVQVVISFSGERKEMLIAAEAAKGQGAKVVALTAPNKSQLSRLADLSLHTIADESQYRSSSIASRTAQNVITDLLFIALVQLREESARQLIDDISSEIKHIF